jgi:hypothetical protein
VSQKVLLSRDEPVVDEMCSEQFENLLTISNSHAAILFASRKFYLELPRLLSGFCGG